MIERWITKSLQNSLDNVPAICLLGPRQVGKTTFAKTIAKGRPSIYLDLESPEAILKLTDPLAYLTQHQDKLIILDEIQRFPDIFLVLRGLIDKSREEGRKGGQFLLLGSASMDLMRQTAESLAGRVRYLSMGGFNLCEVEGSSSAEKNLWFRGGFPESYLAPTDEIAQDWLEDFIKTYLERDVPQLGFRVPADRLRRLWTMLAHTQGEVANVSKLSASLEMDRKSVSHYIDILTDLLLVRRLEPWHGNVKKRLIKAPRFYIRDSGIAHHLLGIKNHEALMANPILGKSWEGFVVENILSLLPRAVATYFYRTSAGAEIDLVIKWDNQHIWAIEVKYGLAPKVNKHFSTTADDIGATHKYVIYGGSEDFPIGNRVEMISLKTFLHKVMAR